MDKILPLIRLLNMRRQYSILLLLLFLFFITVIIELIEENPFPKYSFVLFLSNCKETIKLYSSE